MLHMHEVWVRLGGVDVLKDVSLHVPKNAFIALVGRNGAGKTSTVRAAMNLLPTYRGTVSVLGRDTTRAKPHDHAANGVGYLPEDRRLIPNWTVEQNILLPTWSAMASDMPEQLQRAYALIPEVRQVRGALALTLSGGQQKLVALARALMCSRNLLILDEPFEGVAPALVQRLLAILSELRKDGSRSVLITESDASHSRRLVDEIHTIERGRIA